MPGGDYLSSIINMWRIYSADSPAANDVCEAFLSKVINVGDFPLTRLSSTTASETSKVLENTYRALNIALMDEWGRFAETVGIDMFEILEGIRKRPTHSNIRQPGFGVGGYCLTKDPLFGDLAARDIFSIDGIDFLLSKTALEINRKMPLNALTKIRSALGSLSGRKILLVGVTYRQDVADTRFSPSKLFYEAALQEGAIVVCFDPLIKYWDELGIQVEAEMTVCPEVDCVLFAVPHVTFRSLSPRDWLKGRTPYVLDANNCLSVSQRETFLSVGCKLESIGRG